MSKFHTLFLEVPRVGEILMEHFSYKNRRDGIMAIIDDGTGSGNTRQFNLTLNVDEVATDFIILKNWGEAKEVNKFLIDKEQTFDIHDRVVIGFHTNLIVKFKEGFYE